VVIACLLGRVEPKWIEGFLLGDVLGVALLKSNEMIVKTLVGRRPARAVRRLTGMQLAKYPLVGGVLYAGVRLAHLAPVAILLGYVMTQVAIVLTAGLRAGGGRRRRNAGRRSELGEGRGT